LSTTFRDRIEGLVGDVDDTSLLTEFLSQEAIHLVELIPAEMLVPHASVTSIPTDAASLSAKDLKLLSVDRNGYEAVQVPFSDRKRVTDTDSYWLASVLTPAYYIDEENGANIIVKPDPALTSAEAKIAYIAHPRVLYNATSVDGMPESFERALMFGASLLWIRHVMHHKRDEYSAITIPSFSLSAIAPVPPSSGSVSAYVAATAGTVATTSVGTLPTVPAFVTPALPAVDLSDFDTHLGKDDVELASTELQKQRTLIEESQQVLNIAVQEFQSGIVEYQAEVQR
jgi:hypothetical protein